MGLRESPEQSKEISPGQRRFSFSHIRGGFNSCKMVPTCSLHRRAQPRKMVAVPAAFSLKSHNSDLSSMSLALPSFCPSIGVQGECLKANESVCGLFKEDSVIASAFCLTQVCRIPTDFRSQVLLGTFLLGTETLSWGAPVWTWGSLLLWGFCS